MTDTLTAPDTTDTTTDSAPDATVLSDASTTPDAAVRASRECIEVDPTILVIGDNVRAAARLDRQFLASLREYGVMEPIHVTRDDEGTLTVKRGQRRTLGAVKAGLLTVPVLIVDGDTDEADRIVKQWHENERRDTLSDTDRLAVVEQLTILGVPAGSIARRLGTPKKQVEAAVTTNGSETAKAAAAKHALTFTDAALIAEFEDDETTVKALLEAVEWGRSTEHVAQRARDEKVRQQARENAVAALVEAGVTVIDRPGYDDKTIKELREIRMVKKDGDPKVNPPTEKEHASCPGHAAYVTVHYGNDPQVTYVCINPKANTHAIYSPNTGGYSTTSVGQVGGGMTDEQKAERRTLIANNKAWDSAETVRRAWLADTFLTRTTPPKGAETFLALAVVHGEHTETSHQTYANLTRLGDEDVASYQRYWGVTAQVEAKADAANPRQVLMLAVALIVREWEFTTSRNTWRAPSGRDRRVLTALIGWGYQPSDVERLILVQPGPVEPVAAKDAQPGGEDPQPGEDDDSDETTPVEDNEPVEGDVGAV